MEPVAGAGAQQRDSSGSRSSRELNATLSRLARGKQLAECRAAFAMGSASGSADSWSHAILINAHATCGDGDGALAALAAMRAAGHRPCVMSYTAALKAPCGRGDLDVARGILAEMEAEFGKPGLPKADDWTPNVRTANTFFRGCLVSGGVDDARALLKRLGRGVWAGGWARQEVQVGAGARSRQGVRKTKRAFGSFSKRSAPNHSVQHCSGCTAVALLFDLHDHIDLHRDAQWQTDHAHRRARVHASVLEDLAD